MTMRLLDQAPPEHDPNDDAHREALDRTGFFGQQAAGALILAASTGRALLVLRSDQVLEPRSWGNNGGAHHADERPEDAARREIREETGWNGDDADLTLLPAYVFSSGAFVYRNFIAVLPEEFTPLLGWEATDHRWCPPDDLPDPLHFGMRALYADPGSLAILRGGWRDMIGQAPRIR